MVDHGAVPRASQPSWLALAVDGPALELPKVEGLQRVRVVPDAASFLALLERARPRIAVVAEPPAGPGDLERIARERRRRHGLRVVQLAAPGAIQTRLQALRLGFDEALPSSVAVEELVGRLTLLEERARAHVDRTLAIANGCQLDLVAHELRRDGQLVHLRPKEFELLAVLASHPGRAYSRRQLLDRAWGHDHDGDPRTVDVHVRWLRSKIEAEPDRPVHLVTVRGLGYRFDPPDR